MGARAARRDSAVVEFAAQRTAAVDVARERYDDELLTVKEAAHETKMSELTIRRAYVAGHLQVRRFGRRGVRIRRRDIQTWLDGGGQTGTNYR